MKFLAYPSGNDDYPIYGAIEGSFTFIITNDAPDGYTASCKVREATPFDGTRHDLGGYAAHSSFDAAKDACEKFYKERS